MQRFRNENGFLLNQCESMRRQNSKDQFPKIIKNYLLDADKKLTDVEILMAQVKFEFIYLKWIIISMLTFFQAQRQFFQSAKYFGENPTVIKTEDFFGIFANFISSFYSTINDLHGSELWTSIESFLQKLYNNFSTCNKIYFR